MVAVAIAALVFTASSARAMRLVSYSLEDYPLDGVGSINDTLRLVLAPLQPDMIAVQELMTQTSVDSFRTAVLERINPGEWAAGPWYDGHDENNCLFYRTTKFRLLGSWSFYPDPPTNYRLVSVYRLKPIGYASAAAEVRFYVVHLQSGHTTSDNAARVVQTAGIRDSMNAMPPGTHAILIGDFNMENNSSTEGFPNLIQSQAKNTGRLIDLLNPTNQAWAWSNNPAFAAYHTDSPCKVPGVDCPSGYGGDGMIERFDFFAPTLNLDDGLDLDLLTNTYVVVGNDGHHFAQNMTADPEIPEGRRYANLLQHGSEHVPIRIDLKLPANLGVAAAIDLGTLIIGGGHDVPISNVAFPPGDSLSYSMSASGGFAAPGGTFRLPAGAQALQPVTIPSGSFGSRSGTLTIASNGFDNPSAGVALSARLLDHAAASLDSMLPQTTATIDFGDHPGGAFSDQRVSIYNRGYDTLHARLSIESASLTGDPHFSIVGGGLPALIGAGPDTLRIHFDDAAVPADSTYQAQLAVHSNDEPLPGATVVPDLVLTLRARVLSGSVDVDEPRPATITQLYPPFPSPCAGAATIRFDLARAGGVAIELLDVTGRRVANLEHATLKAGRHSIHWAADEGRGSPLSAGIYFLRLTSGRDVRTQRIALVH